MLHYESFWKNIPISSQVFITLLTLAVFVHKMKICIFTIFKEPSPLTETRFFKSIFQFLKVERKGVRLLDPHYSWKPNAGVLWCAKCVKRNFFDFDPLFWIGTSSVKMLTCVVSSCNDKWIVKCSCRYHLSVKIYE